MLIVIGQALILVTIATVGVVFRRQQAPAIPEGAERFRFDDTRWVFFVFAVLCAIAGDFAWAFPSRTDGPDAVYAYFFIADVIPPICLYSFVYCTALYVDLDDSGITVASLYRVRRWPYLSIGRAYISTGSFGRTSMNVVMVYDKAGSKVARVTGNYEDFTRFTWLLEDGLRHTDAVVQERRGFKFVVKGRGRKP